MSSAPNAATVTGPSQLRVPPVSVPPGVTAAPQPPTVPVPPPQYPSLAGISVSHRAEAESSERLVWMFVRITAAEVPRHPGPPYQGHDLGKVPSPALSQVSAPPAPAYRYLKGWEPGGTPSYSPTQNAGSASLIYSPQTQPMNVQPPSRPFVTGPRPTHHQKPTNPDVYQEMTDCLRHPGRSYVRACLSMWDIMFLHRAQMQTPRPALPTNTPSLRHGSQTPTAAAVYPPNQTIMMTMTPMPFPSAQTAQYYIPQPQYRHSSPYVGPPQQFSVPPPASGTFYPGPGPGEYPAPYATAAPGPAYFPGQTVYPSSAPIIVPTAPQQPPPAKREKKPIRIRDPNQGGKDITEEIMAGSGNTTPPVGRPSSTPTPPQQRSASQTPEQLYYNMDPPYRLSPDSKPTLEDKPRADFAPHKSSSPGPSESSTERREAPTLPVSDASSHTKPGMPSSFPLPLSTCNSKVAGEPEELSKISTTVAQSPIPVEEETLPEATPSPTASSPSPGKAVNGLSESPPPSPICEQEIQVQDVPLTSTQSTTLAQNEAPVSGEAIQTEAPAPVTQISISPTTLIPSNAMSPLAPSSCLPVLIQPPRSDTDEQGKARGANDVHLKAETAAQSSDGLSETHSQTNSRKITATVQAASVAPKDRTKTNEENSAVDSLHEENKEESTTDGSAGEEVCRPASEMRNGFSPAPACFPEENGETETEPLKNGDGPVLETEHLDNTVTPEEGKGSPVQEVLTQPNGKRQYDRDFLLGFQFMPACVQKPEGLPQITDVVLDKINQTKLPIRPVDPRVLSRGPDFTPAFADFSRQLLGGRGAPLLSLPAWRPQPRKIIMNVSVNDEVQLQKAENAWKPGIKKETLTEDQETQKTQELFRKVRSILNKLTPQMFTQLMKQVTDLTINTEERLKGVIDLVFEKAIDEPSFSVAYANMCHCLATLKVPMADKPGTTVNFRKLLLNRCQKEFERDKMDDAVFERKRKELDCAASTSEKERLQEELEEAKDKARRRSTGNIKFIGELFKLRMLTEAIMHDCVVKLLKNHDDESLECLCRLLTTIGKDLDFEKAKPRMDQYFNQMEKIVKERKTSSRIRFMVQDVIDLRLHNWVSRRADQGPKTIEQIHKEARIEEQEEQRKVHQQLLSKDKRRPDPRDQRGLREETWSTVPMTKNSRTIDPTKIPKISKSQFDDKIQLGPRAQLSWVKGSSGGAKASNSESPSGTSSLNRYSALQSSTMPPAQTPDPDSKHSLTSRGSCGRERSENPQSTGPSRLLNRSSSNKELGESAAAEEPSRDTQATSRKTSISEDRSNTEHSQSRDPSVKKESSVSVAPAKPVLSEEEMERKSKSIIDEFLHINDYKEAVQCVEELQQVSPLAVFVRVGVESTLERSHMAREHMGQLFYQLIHRGSLQRAQLYAGLADTLETADDMAIDIPHIWLYLAELLSPLLKEGGISMRELFSEISKPLLPVGKAGILMAEILHLLCKQMGQKKVGSLWREAGLNWSDFLSEEQELQSFISEQKLQFTLSDCSSAHSAPPMHTLTPDELHRHLERLLLEDLASDEQIFDWVEANVDESQMSSSPFLRALMTAVCKAAVRDENSSCRVDTAIIQKHLPVLQKYFNSDTERQLQALYALQALIVTLDQPPNLLRMFFDCLYDEDVISEDAFYKWETCKDPAEQQGKGIALKSVTAFFTWLREAEEESEDN
ncbi:eukaryotic translation initiation factor 4 gamma 3 isoform X3 [Pangasianodon hypophthalmus]|uniref:eukaryotic translation initiation factor 4 gamma 3 isoform X3 n=1 Tax=Pangasianodon hypophthalmus TaxID=310915 RepID=UPI00230786E0|nr:eukaryotic translation initiation factor 4 gamma 3 isoform X3 [Pangasianodon hypophthalmus]